MFAAPRRCADGRAGASLNPWSADSFAAFIAAGGYRLTRGYETHAQINGVVQKVAAAENIAIPDHVSLLLSRISLGNLRRAILSFEALYAQDPAFKSVKPDHSLLTTGKQDARDIDAVPRPDWEKYAAKTAEKIMSDQKPETLLEVRGMFYELLVHCIPAQLILAVRLSTSGHRFCKLGRS